MKVDADGVSLIRFAKSDIIHQSVFELIHSEDRDEFKKQLAWNSKLPADKANLKLSEVLSNRGEGSFCQFWFPW